MFMINNKNQKAWSWAICGKSAPGRRNSISKGWGAGMSSMCLRNRNEASVAELRAGSGLRVESLAGPLERPQKELGF